MHAHGKWSFNSPLPHPGPRRRRRPPRPPPAALQRHRGRQRDVWAGTGVANARGRQPAYPSWRCGALVPMPRNDHAAPAVPSWSWGCSTLAVSASIAASRTHAGKHNVAMWLWRRVLGGRWSSAIMNLIPSTATCTDVSDTSLLSSKSDAARGGCVSACRVVPYTTYTDTDSDDVLTLSWHTHTKAHTDPHTPNSASSYSLYPHCICKL